MEHAAKRFSRKSIMKWRKHIAGTALIVVVGVAGFYGGVTYQKHRTTSSNNMSNANTAQNFAGNGNSSFSGGFRRGGGGRVIGQVTAISTASITVQAQDGSSTTLAITSSTTITENGQTVATSSIQNGDTVFITEDSSNASDAARIMVNPSFGGGQSQTQSQGTAQTQTD